MISGVWIIFGLSVYLHYWVSLFYMNTELQSTNKMEVLDAMAAIVQQNTHHTPTYSLSTTFY